MFRITVGFLLLAVATAGKPTPIRDSTDGLTPDNEEVRYRCDFEGLWTSKRHPKDYPVRSAHWSPPVIASHSTAYSLWMSGAKATPGIEELAESGDPSPLEKELARADGVLEYEVLANRGGDLWAADNLLTMNSTHNRISSISMIAPSPDWFSGFRDVAPINKKTGNWYYKFALRTSPYDAGTEKGETYSFFHPDQNPKRNIRRIRPSNAPGDGLFVTMNGNKRRILKVAEWTCVQDNGREDCDQYKPNARLVRRCERRNRARDNSR